MDYQTKYIAGIVIISLAYLSTIFVVIFGFKQPFANEITVIYVIAVVIFITIIIFGHARNI
jgi:hypothetical protein